MNKKLTDLTVILDRSGSMIQCWKEAQDGLNKFINDQKDVEGCECNFSLVEFNGSHSLVYDCVDIKEVPEYELKPDGMTAMHDAVGWIIQNTGKRLAAMDEKDRPGKVICLIITDGQENCSREYSGSTVRGLIDRQKNDYSWEFVYIGANQDAISTGRTLGLRSDVSVDYSIGKTDAMYQKMSSNVSNARVTGCSISFSDQDKKDLS